MPTKDTNTGHSLKNSGSKPKQPPDKTLKSTTGSTTNRPTKKDNTSIKRRSSSPHAHGSAPKKQPPTKTSKSSSSCKLQETCKSLSVDYSDLFQDDLSDASGIISDDELRQDPNLLSLQSNIVNSGASKRIFPSITEISSDINNHQQNKESVRPIGNTLTNSNMSLSQSQQTSTKNQSARLDLSSIENTSELSEIKQILLTSKLSQTKLTSCNPHKIKMGLDHLCGEVKELEYLQSGSLLVTVKEDSQRQLLENATIYPILNIPINASIAWGRQFSYGKIFAPQLSEETLEEILEILSPLKVVSVRKLFNDPARSHVPLYVLTFLGTLPTTLKVGYISYNIEKYYPTPLQCRKCWRLRHATKNCRSKPSCGKCSSLHHTTSECDSTPFCINCKGDHPSSSHKCPAYLKERNICTIKTDLGISFPEARAEEAKQQSSFTAPHATNSQSSMATQQISQQSQMHHTPNSPPRSFHRHSQQIGDYTELNSGTDTNNNWEDSSLLQVNEEQLITPGQRTRKLYSQVIKQTKDNSSHQVPSQLSLPSLSPIYTAEPTVPPDKHCKSPFISSEFYQAKKQQPAQNDLFTKVIDILPKLLPLLIKLILCSNYTDKIECITNIGKLIDMSSIVTEALSAMDSLNHTNNVS